MVQVVHVHWAHHSSGSYQNQAVLDGLTIHPAVANFLQCTCAKNYENWLAVDKVIQ